MWGSHPLRRSFVRLLNRALQFTGCVSSGRGNRRCERARQSRAKKKHPPQCEGVGRETGGAGAPHKQGKKKSPRHNVRGLAEISQQMLTRTTGVLVVLSA